MTRGDVKREKGKGDWGRDPLEGRCFSKHGLDWFRLFSYQIGVCPSNWGLSLKPNLPPARVRGLPRAKFERSPLSHSRWHTRRPRAMCPIVYAHPSMNRTATEALLSVHQCTTAFNKMSDFFPLSPGLRSDQRKCIKTQKVTNATKRGVSFRTERYDASRAAGKFAEAHVRFRTFHVSHGLGSSGQNQNPEFQFWFATCSTETPLSTCRLVR